MNKTLKLACTAMLAALSVVANAFSIQISGSNYLSFTFIPCFIAAMNLGILPATIVGFVGDLIAGLIFPKGPYNILIGVASTLIGTIPAVVYKLMPRHRLIALVTSLAACLFVCTAGLNTYALWLLYGMKKGETFWVYLWGRLPFQLVNIVANGVIIGTLQQTKALDKLFEKFQTGKKAPPEQTKTAEKTEN